MDGSNFTSLSSLLPNGSADSLGESFGGGLKDLRMPAPPCTLTLSIESADPSMAKYFNILVGWKLLWPEEWMRCVEALYKVQQIDGWPIQSTSGMLSAKYRPAEVSPWLRNGRRETTKEWPIDDLHRFKQAFWTWWCSLQPGRTIDHLNMGSFHQDDDSSFDCLDKTGSCGVILVVMCLSWWGAKVHQEDGRRLDGWMEWFVAVCDVAYALEELAVWKDKRAVEAEEEEEEEDGSEDKEGKGAEDEHGWGKTRKRKSPSPSLPVR